MSSFPDYVTCIRLLLRHSTPSNVISHSIHTAQTALRVVERMKSQNYLINCDIILAGALLHDIGRCKSHRINHGIIGAQLLREEGFPEELARIAENHLFAGITKHEALKLGLPFQDYLPLTLEEKIITYADNVSKGESILSIDEVIDRYSKYLIPSHPILKRVRLLHLEIDVLLNKK
ncbi:MAG: HDIG domain-containing metalloprotein [Promethearchaeota archaeon]